MSTSEIIEHVKAESINLSVSAADNSNVTGDPSVVDRLLPTIRDRKPDILHELHRKHDHTTVISMLESYHDKRYAFRIADGSTNLVLIKVGIRNIATFNFEIFQKNYVVMGLMEIMEKH